VPLAIESSNFPENELLLRQLIYADIILLNKVDLIPETSKQGTIELIRDCIAKVNSNANIVETSHSQVDLETIIAPISGD